MGSAASSSVQVYDKAKPKDKDLCSSKSNQRASEGDVEGRPTSSVSGRGASAKRKARVTPVTEVGLGTSVEANRNTVKSAQNQMEQMEKQLAELESQNLDLEDQVYNLQQHVGALVSERRGSQGDAPDLTHSPAAKDQYIQQLEKQTEDVQTEIAKLKRKYKRKLRSLNTSLSEAKQGQSVHAFELKQELQHLTEENTRLTERVGRLPDVDQEDTTMLSTHIDGRTQIIVELSAQVSEQDARITEFEQQLAEKDCLIQELRDGAGSEGREGSAGSRQPTEQGYVPRWRSSMEPEPSIASDSETKDEGSRLKQTFRDENGQDEMKAIAQEVGSYQKSRSAGTSRVKRRNERSRADYRESSGISRDSGIVALTDSATGAKKSSTETESDCSDWGDSDPEDQGSAGTSNPAERTTELDPYSIRRISAAKMRKKTPDSSRSSQGGGSSHSNTRGSKPPVYRASKNTYDSDLNSLLSSFGTYDTGVKTS